LLKSLKYPNLKIFTNGIWECANDYHRLSILANQTKGYLKTNWHFMLQADEVIHEDSFPFIKQAINDKHFRSYYVRRLNLFGDLYHYLDLNLPQEHKPCSDSVIRLATIENDAYSDAESLSVNPQTSSMNYLDKITIFHYGFVRKDVNHIEKIIDMQGWFFGKGGTPDKRALELRETGKFDWRLFKPKEFLVKIPKPHPVFSKNWAEERNKDKIFVE
jgi:hypothetical protein